MYLLFRKREHELCSNSLSTYYIYIFSMGLYCLFYDGKSKSSSFFVFSSGKVCLVKSFPDFIQGTSWNSDAIIFD